MEKTVLGEPHHGPAQLGHDCQGWVRGPHASSKARARPKTKSVRQRHWSPAVRWDTLKYPEILESERPAPGNHQCEITAALSAQRVVVVSRHDMPDRSEERRVGEEWR